MLILIADSIASWEKVVSSAALKSGHNGLLHTIAQITELLIQIQHRILAVLLRSASQIAFRKKIMIVIACGEYRCIKLCIYQLLHIIDDRECIKDRIALLLDHIIELMEEKDGSIECGAFTVTDHCAGQSFADRILNSPLEHPYHGMIHRLGVEILHSEKIGCMPFPGINHRMIAWSVDDTFIRNLRCYGIYKRSSHALSIFSETIRIR